MATAEVPPRTHDVFENPELLTRLLIHQCDLGYRLGTLYTACATAYVALAGIAAQYYFSLMPVDHVRARWVAIFGLSVSLFALAAPFGLRNSCRELEAAANRYAAALGLPAEKFTVIWVGSNLSLVAFATITMAWGLLIWRAS